MTKAEMAARLKDEIGMDYPAIARAMGLPVPSVRRLVHKGRLRAAVASANTFAAVTDQLAYPKPAEQPVFPPERGTIRWGDGPDFITDPAEVSSSRPTRHILIPDTQCKPGVPLDHLKWAGRYIAEQAPDVVVLIGDHWDMPSLSSYDRGKKSFEGRRYREDIKAGNDGMEMLMEGISKAPKMPRLVLTLGNHEARCKRLIEEEPWLEGTVGYQDFNTEGWEVYDFLVPVKIHGVTYSHYFYNPYTGRPYSGTVANRLKNIGFSFTQGHTQGFQYDERALSDGTVHIGLVAGSFYQHEENYKGPQGNHHWRGIIVKNEVRDGSYDILKVSLGYLSRKFSRG